MEVSNTVFKYLAIGLSIVIVTGAMFIVWDRRQQERRVVDLQNEIAKRDTTIEVQKNVFAKLTQQVDDLKGMIDTSTEEGRALKKQIERSNSEILALQNVVVRLREQIAHGQGQQTQEGDRTRVVFGQDFGFVRVDGFTLTNPAEYELKLVQGSHPLKLTLTLNQQEDGSWKTLVASSDSNVAVDVGLAGVNPRVLAPSWYEGIKFRADIGLNKAGVLGGLAATLKIGHFDLGPGLWASTNGGGAVWYGGTLAWAPFAR